MGQYKPLVYRTFRPTVTVFVICIIAEAFFGTLAFRTYALTKTTIEVNTIIAGYGISLLFFMFFIYGIYTLLNIKTVITHPSGIIIKYPLLFRTKGISYRDIVSNKETPQLVMHKGSAIYRGTRIWLTMENGKKLEINSLETKDFYTLKDTIKRSVHSAAARKQNEQERV